MRNVYKIPEQTKFVQRKLIKQGNTSAVVSLPIEWIRSQKLKIGDSVEVECNPDRITITVKDEEKIKQCDLNVEALDEMTMYVNLLNLYRKGFDEVRLISKSNTILDYQTNKKINLLNSIKTWLPRFLGWEIIKQDPIIIKDITGKPKEDPEKLLQRVFFILNDFVDDEINAIKNKNSLPNPNEFYMTTFKLINYSIRTYNKRSQMNPKIILLQQLHKISQKLRDTQKYLKNNQEIVTQVLTLLRPVLATYMTEEISSFIKQHYIVNLELTKIKTNNDLLRLLTQLHQLFIDITYTVNFLQLDQKE